jgi:tetratricopeptide (TPR) repeat protein
MQDLYPDDERYFTDLIALYGFQGRYEELFGLLLMAKDADANYLPSRIKLGTVYFRARQFDLASAEADELMAMAPDDPGVRILAARLAFHDGQEAEGLAHLDYVLGQDPMNAEALLLQSLRYRKTDVDRSLSMLAQAMQLLPLDVGQQFGNYRLGILSGTQRYPEFEAELVKMQDLYPDDERYFTDLIALYGFQGRYEDADRMLEGRISRQPDDVAAIAAYVQFLIITDRPEMAERLLMTEVNSMQDSTALLIALGNFYETSGRNAEALDAYSRAVDQASSLAEEIQAKNMLASAYLVLGEKEMARGAVSEVLSASPSDPSALLLEAAFLYNDRLYEDSIGAVRIVLRQRPEDAQALLLLARNYAQQRQFVLAQEAYIALLQSDRENADGQRELGDLFARTSDFDRAEQLLRQRLEADPDDFIAKNRLVDVLVATDQLDEAIVLAGEMIAFDDSSSSSYLQRARALLLSKKYPESIDDFAAVLARDPDSELALAGIVEAYEQSGNARGAERFLEAHLEANPTNSGSMVRLGGVKARLGDADAAMRLFEQAVDSDPEKVNAYMAAAGVYADDIAAQIRVLERGLSANPDAAVLGMLLGTAYGKVGRVNDQMALYQKLIDLNPSLDPALNNLALLLLDNDGRPQDIARAVKLVQGLSSSKNPDYLDTVGWVYYVAEDYPRAVGFLERAAAASGESGEIQYHLGMAYVKTGNDPGASQALAKAIDLGGEDAEYGESARQALALLAPVALN